MQIDIYIFIKSTARFFFFFVLGIEPRTSALLFEPCP
jgi:hypothetical protein